MLERLGVVLPMLLTVASDTRLLKLAALNPGLFERCGCMCVYLYVCVRTYTCMYVCMYVCMDGCVCVCVYVCMCASVCRHMHAQCREHTSAQDAGLLGGSKPSTPGQRASAIAWDTSVTPARVTIVTILPAFSPSAPLAPQHHTSACVGCCCASLAGLLSLYYTIF